RSISLYGSLLFALFAWGQICGLWFRSALVSVLVALLLSMFIVGWHVVVFELETPPLLTAWPLALLWLVAAYRQMPAWLDGDRTRPVLLQRTAWMLAPPLLVGVLLCVTRRWQIPELPQTAVVYAAGRPEAEVRQELSQDMLVLEQALAMPLTVRPTQEQRRGVSDLDGHVIESLLTSWTNTSSPWRDAGQFNRELDLSLTALRIARQQMAVDGRQLVWPRSLNNRQDVCRRIADWANDERQTLDQLERAIPLLEMEFDEEYDVASTATAWRQEMLDSTKSGLTPFEIGSEPPLGVAGRSLMALLGEPDRQRRLIDQISAAVPTLVNARAYQTQDAVATFRSQDGRDQSVRFADLASVERWGDSVIGHLSGELAAAPFLIGRLNDEIKQTRTAENACLLIVALQAHRLRHGTFPGDVIELLNGPLLNLPRYPFDSPGNSLFEFRSAGYSRPLVTGTDEVLPAAQPLLTVPGVREFARYLAANSDLDAPDHLVLTIDPREGHILNRDIAREVAVVYHSKHPTRIAVVAPLGNTRSWFCASRRELDGRQDDLPPDE
ncbi:MAG: hypothetical protein KDA75_19280, partial [Planctomycetaceae bacterium]|nr:hypothetical protein [Planctomycetaceae bacterium]